jgi:hypothetical protein
MPFRQCCPIARPSVILGPIQGRSLLPLGNSIAPLDAWSDRCQRAVRNSRQIALAGFLPFVHLSRNGLPSGGARLEKVVGATIVNRFPYVFALSLCRQPLSPRHYVRRAFMDGRAAPRFSSSCPVRRSRE